jgi:hypothetical protein
MHEDWRKTMSEHMTAWLGAYMDGELRGKRLQEVEVHLVECALCRAELEDLKQLSAQLKSSPPASTTLNGNRFASRVIMQLPPRPGRVRNQSIPAAIWWLLPATLFVAWAFINTTDYVTNLLSFLLGTGLMKNTGGWVVFNTQGGDWFTALLGWAQSGLTGSGWMGVRLLGGAELFFWNMLFSLIPMAALGMLLWGWLAGWWVYQRQEAVYK